MICTHIRAPRPQLCDAAMEKKGCEINNKRTEQAVGKGTVGRRRARDETFRNGCKSTGIEERWWQEVTEGKKGE